MEGCCCPEAHVLSIPPLAAAGWEDYRLRALLMSAEAFPPLSVLWTEKPVERAGAGPKGCRSPLGWVRKTHLFRLPGRGKRRDSGMARATCGRTGGWMVTSTHGLQARGGREAPAGSPRGNNGHLGGSRGILPIGPGSVSSDHTWDSEPSLGSLDGKRSSRRRGKCA